MTPTPPTPAVPPGGSLADRFALRELAEAYAFAVDRRDEGWFRTLWLPDARLTTHEGDGPPQSDMQGVDAIARVTTLLERFALTLHVVANHRCELIPGGVGEPEADRATGEAYCIGHHLTPLDDGRHDDLVMGIRYLDRYRRDGSGAWRFASREVRKQWTRHEVVDGHPPSR